MHSVIVDTKTVLADEGSPRMGRPPAVATYAVDNRTTSRRDFKGLNRNSSNRFPKTIPSVISFSNSLCSREVRRTVYKRLGGMTFADVSLLEVERRNP